EIVDVVVTAAADRGREARIGDVGLDETEIALPIEIAHILDAAGDQIVDAIDLAALAEQLAGEIAADEAGAAGDEDATSGFPMHTHGSLLAGTPSMETPGKRARKTSR